MQNHFEGVVGKYIIYNRERPYRKHPRSIAFRNKVKDGWYSVGAFPKNEKLQRHCMIISFDTLTSAKDFYLRRIRADWRQTLAIGKVTSKGIRYVYKEL